MKSLRVGAKGFTLIELLIVVAIIGILAAIAIPNFLQAQTRSKVARVKADMTSLVTCLETYRVDNNEYPPTLGLQEGRYRFLTTPITYIKGVAPDPFGSGVRDSWTRNGVLCYYTYDFITHYSPALWGAPFSPAYWDYLISQTKVSSPNSRKYYLASCGPDRRVGLDVTSPEYMATAYDPTNGTVSLGDIHRIGP